MSAMFALISSNFEQFRHSLDTSLLCVQFGQHWPAMSANIRRARPSSERFRLIWGNPTNFGRHFDQSCVRDQAFGGDVNVWRLRGQSWRDLHQFGPFVAKFGKFCVAGSWLESATPRGAKRQIRIPQEVPHPLPAGSSGSSQEQPRPRRTQVGFGLADPVEASVPLAVAHRSQTRQVWKSCFCGGDGGLRFEHFGGKCASAGRFRLQSVIGDALEVCALASRGVFPEVRRCVAAENGRCSPSSCLMSQDQVLDRPCCSSSGVHCAEHGRENHLHSGTAK